MQTRLAASVLLAISSGMGATFQPASDFQPIRCELRLATSEPKLPDSLVRLPDAIETPLDVGSAYDGILTLSCQKSQFTERLRKFMGGTSYEFSVTNLLPSTIRIMAAEPGHQPVHGGKVYGDTWVDIPTEPDYSIYQPQFRIAGAWKTKPGGYGDSHWVDVAPGGKLKIYETFVRDSQPLECLLLTVPFKTGDLVGGYHLSWSPPQ